MSEPLVITHLMQTSGACPSQWEGDVADGRRIYIRSRHDELTVSVGRTLDDAVDAGYSTELDEGAELLLRIDDEAAGILSEPDMLRLAAGVVKDGRR